MAQITERRTAMSTEVALGDFKAFASYRQVTRAIPTMVGVQRHRGYVGVVSTRTSKEDCGHRLHSKAASARACAVKGARRKVREMAKEA